MPTIRIKYMGAALRAATIDGIATLCWDNDSPTTSAVDLGYNPNLFVNQLAC